MSHVLRYAARTDRGLLRANNQDSVFAGDRLLVIADGMGGHAAGDVASRLVVSAFVDLNELPLGSDMVRPLTEATMHGNADIAEMVEQNPEFDGMGTTLTALLFDGPVVALAHVGDSRAYLFRNGVLHQISHDDTFVQSLVDDGRITAEEAAHHPQRSLLLRALNGTEMDPSITMRETSPGDRFLICSDGLSDVVSPESIADALTGPDPDHVADTLIQLALVGGGPDNVTVIVADVVETGRPTSESIPGGVIDPEATGPMQPIHLTQKMPRVPLPPIPEDVPAKPVYAPDEDGQDLPDADDEFDDEFDDDDQEYEPGSGLDGGAAASSGRAPIGRPMTAPPPGRRGHRRWAFALAVVVLIGVGLTGSYLWASTKYYVGDHDDQVAVFRGVDGSLLGWKFASVQENSCGATGSGCTPLKVDDLVQAARDQVSAGIPVSTLADARAVINRLTSQQLPPCPAPGTSATVVAGSTTGTGSGAAIPSSSTASMLAPTPTAVPPVVPVRPSPTTKPRPTAAPAPVKPVPARTTPAGRTAARTTPQPEVTARPSTARPGTAAKPAIAPRPAATSSRPPVPVTIRVTVTVNPAGRLASRATAAQRLRAGRAGPAADAPVTRPTAAVVTPTVTVITTVTGPAPSNPVLPAPVPSIPGQSNPVPSTGPTSTGTPLVVPAAEPGVTCRLVS